MLNRRGLVAALALTCVLAFGGVAMAKGPHKHQNGHSALGAKLKQNGKHQAPSWQGWKRDSYCRGQQRQSRQYECRQLARFY